MSTNGINHLNISEVENNSDNDSELKSEKSEINFDLQGLNDNLTEIKRDVSARIKNLDESQKVLKTKLSLLEKFMKIDENDLAIEYTKPEPNQNTARQLKKSISNYLELFTNTTDIYLKYEGLIQTWTKSLMDIEKDKVSAFQKIKSLDKSVTSGQADITSVISDMNTFIKNDVNLSKIAHDQLRIANYSGTKFNN